MLACLPITPCCLGFDDSHHFADTMNGSGSHSWSCVGTFRNTTCWHVSMLAADMSAGGSSQHDMMPIKPTQPNGEQLIAVDILWAKEELPWWQLLIDTYFCLVCMRQTLRELIFKFRKIIHILDSEQHPSDIRLTYHLCMKLKMVSLKFT